MAFPTYMEGKLWHHYARHSAPSPAKPTVRRLSSQTEYELWHHRLVHTKSTCLCNMNKYNRGIVKFKEPDFLWFFLYVVNIKTDTSAPFNYKRRKTSLAKERVHSEQHLHVDYGFVRGSAFKSKDAQGRPVTIIDSFWFYLIIADRGTRYKWLFLIKTKDPLNEIDQVFNKFYPSIIGIDCTVRTDQEGKS